MCIWLYNVTLRVSFAAGRWLIQGPLLKSAWSRPIAQIPILLGCVALGLPYYDWAATDGVWLLLNGFSNETTWAAGHAAAYLGEKAGNVVVATAAAYSDFLGLMFGFLVCGWASRQVMTHFFCASPMGFSCGDYRPETS